MLIQRLLRKQDRLTRSRITDLYSGILRYNRQSHHLSFPVAPCCPPGRGCYAQTPSDIGIDTKKPLSGTVPPYTQHVVISTGRDDWASRIESEQGSNLARDLKELLGPKGEFHNPDRSVLVTNSSFPLVEPDEPSSSPKKNNNDDNNKNNQNKLFLDDNDKSKSPSATSHKNGDFISARLFPSFQYIPRIPNTPEGHRALIQDFILPARISLPRLNNQSTPSNPPGKPLPLLHSPTSPQPITQPTILICGHATRDRRCGILGPLLRAELKHRILTPFDSSSSSSSSSPHVALLPQPHYNINNNSIALISHIGGHAFAGNLIIYIPPGYVPSPPSSYVERQKTETNVHALAGMGIWYGRVEPRHISGILEATLGKGEVIEELFRGGVRTGGEEEEEEGFTTL